MNSSQDIYEAYKPFRNKIRKTSVEDSLYVIWAYAQYMQLDSSIPSDIEVHPLCLSNQFAERGLYPWDLELLARETMLNGEVARFSRRKHDSLKSAPFFTKMLNQLRAIDGAVSREYINSDNILIEFSRLLYRQIQWQQLHLSSYLIRFYKIFSTAKIDAIVKETTGLATKEIFQIGMLIYFEYFRRPAVRLPIDYGVPEFSKEKVNIFLSRFATSLENIKSLIENEQKYDDQFFYCGIALRYYPLIEMQYKGERSLVCPLPTILFWRITSGLFYDIYQRKGFGNAFGESFENYVGDVFQKILPDTNLRAIKEVKFKIGKDDKKTTDWILCDANAGIFVECKTKKMQNGSKTRINDIAVITEDLNILASAIVQCYKTIADYRKNLYPNLEYDSNRVIYPLILTLEDWYVFHPQYQNQLREIIVCGLIENNLPEGYITLMPYSYCSIGDFEGMIQVVAKVGIKELFEPKLRDLVKNNYVFGTYYGSMFPEETKEIIPNLFEDEYNAIFDTLNF